MKNVTGLIPNLKLSLCDADGKPSVFINLYSDFEYTERYKERSSFSFTVSRNAPHVDMLIPGRFIIVPRDELRDTMRLLVIKQISVDDTEVTVSGCDYLWELFSYRVVYGGVGSGDESDDQTGVAETVARHFIESEITAATDPLRRDSNVVLEAAHTVPLGDIVTVEGHFQTMQKLMETVCTSGNIGIEGVLIEDDTRDTGWYLKICITQGTDRSQSTVLGALP